jgi:hypothetical protein
MSKIFKGLFGSPSASQTVIQPAEPPPPAPTIDLAAQNADRMDQLRKRRGRASTILVADSGQALTPQGLGGPGNVLGG